MITTTIEWYSPAEKLPEKSGNYLVRYARSDGFAELHYSSKYKLFNALDWDTEEEAQKSHIPVAYWTERIALPEDESEDE
jgi:hypothetical protein